MGQNLPPHHEMEMLLELELLLPTCGERPVLWCCAQGDEQVNAPTDTLTLHHITLGLIPPAQELQPHSLCARGAKAAQLDSGPLPAPLTMAAWSIWEERENFSQGAFSPFSS